jgi:hypothetical protein
MAYGNADAYVARQPDRLVRGHAGGFRRGCEHVYAPDVHAYAHVRVGSAVRVSGGSRRRCYIVIALRLILVVSGGTPVVLSVAL